MLLLLCLSALSVAPLRVGSDAPQPQPQPPQPQQKWLLNMQCTVTPPYNQSELPATVNPDKIGLLSMWFGQMPCIGCTGRYAGTDTWCNGGIPQLANTTAHVLAMERDMVAMESKGIPADFDGYLVHDWEAWEATWGYATDEYRNASIALARSQNPAVTSEAELEKIAAAAWTNASVELLALTARTTRRLRPKARGVGFYGLPHKQYWPSPQLNATQMAWNDLFLPLWQEQTAFFPSVPPSPDPSTLSALTLTLTLT